MVLRINHGPVNALDRELVRAMTTGVQDIGAARGIVITGTERVFSAGVDLHRLLDEDMEYARSFLTELDSLVQVLFNLPVPVVAAITGHAIAGGCLLAAACDYRVMAGGRIGVTEARVGLPLPPAGLEAFRYAAGAHAERLVLTGQTLQAQEALALGLIDEVTTQDTVERRAVDIARQLTSAPAQTFRVHKQMLRADASRRMREAMADHTALVGQAWTAEEPRWFAGEFMAELKKGT